MQKPDMPDMPGYGLGTGEDIPPATAAPSAGPDSDLTPEPGPEASDADKQQDTKDQSIKDSLGSFLAGLWFDWSQVRRPLEDEWLVDLRAYSGKYEARDLAEIGPTRSKLFIHITRVKVMAAYSRIIDLYTQSKDEPWDIEPTPEPELSPEEADAIQKEITDAGLPVTEQTVDAATTAVVKDRTDKMRIRIQDQLDESNWMMHFKSAVKELCILGNGVLRGATAQQKQTKAWQQTQAAWAVSMQTELVPACSWVSIWDFYPDPYADCVDNAHGVFERMVLTREQLNKLARIPGFSAELIAQAINGSPNGNHQPLPHELERRELAGFTSTASGSNRYDVLQYWGNVSGQELAAAGVTVADQSQQYQANVWVLDGRTIRAVLNPTTPCRIPYQMAPYEQMPGNMWGIGPPRQMRDAQIMLNAIVRAMVDNAAITSGPQVEVNDDLAAAGSNTDEITPWKVWHRAGGDAQYQMLKFYYPESNIAELESLQAEFRKYCDEETSLPSYTHGEQMPGLNKTAAGMSMLMAAANVVIKSVIKNVDDYLIAPLITSFYDWNMQYGEDDSIKGDMSIIARGSTALIAKEIQSQRIQALLQAIATNPQGMAIADIAYLYRSLADSLDLDGKKAFPDEKVEAYERATSASGPAANGAPGVPGGAPVPPGGGAPADAGGDGQPLAAPPGTQPGTARPAAAA